MFAVLVVHFDLWTDAKALLIAFAARTMSREKRWPAGFLWNF